MSDKKLLMIATDFTYGLLGKRDSKDWCFAVCAPLAGYLEMCGIPSELVEYGIRKNGKEVFHHWCLQLEDGRILDPTADQFETPEGNKRPRIFLGMPPVWYGKPIKQ